MKGIKKPLVLRLRGLAPIASIVIAIQADARNFEFQAEWLEELRRVQNANFSTAPENEIDETQIESALLVSGLAQHSGRTQASFAYKASKTHYSEDSQEEETLVSGRTQVDLGEAATFTGWACPTPYVNYW